MAILMSAGPARAALSDAIAYVPDTLSMSDAYLIEWQSGSRAQLVGSAGARGGGVARRGSQRVITLDAPFSAQFYAADLDSCGEQPLQQQDTLQVAVDALSGTDRRGTAAVATLGTLTTLTGCDAGQVVPFGALTDPGITMRNLALTLRPAVTDLVPGVALAGPSEEERLDGFPGADVLTLQAGGLGIFATTGHVVGAAFSADQWLVLTLPIGDRAYTRLSVDRRTGAEVWLDADWVAGAPANVRQTLMVKTAAGAGFGTVRQASREWESGLFIGADLPFFIYLYQNGNGERVQKNPADGTETRSPITWAFSGTSIVQRRALGSTTGVRTWRPLANGGGRAHFVMEDEVRVDASGGLSVAIRPRVNFYVDGGAATPP